MNTLPSSSLEDRFSIVLSRLEGIEASLVQLEDVKKLLVAIEDNTHPHGNDCDSRKRAQEKVSFEIITTFLIKGICMSKALLKKSGNLG